ncbi:MAG: hypothetical protein DRQ41_01105 [Gammaproteobacteria bacterium]|nr:MAG: hypothetical protein DRQ41_01105 [Gammaproteobacteria bacterium]RKZ75333.1 MAG: hypothetical protein DRQ57_07985 [Gammaproteobacteria bacterium]
MFNGVRQRVTVGKGGRIDFLSPELPVGVTVEIIVLIEPPHQETQKERLLRLSANDKQLQQARKEFASEQWVELGNNYELDELLKK